jgi:hypothetical protein
MSKDLKNLDIKALPDVLKAALKTVSRYRWLLFLAFVTVIYGFIGYRIYSLSRPNNSSASVQAQVTTLTPHIDPAVVSQLTKLQDNSVSVQALFNQSRDNPFAE